MIEAQTAADTWAEWTAIGTLILAVVTVVAVVTTIVITKGDRKRNDDQLKDDRDRVDRQIADDRDLARANAERDRTIDLLIRLSSAIATISGRQGDAGRATHEAQMLLRALPGHLAVFAREALGVRDSTEKMFSDAGEVKYETRLNALTSQGGRIGTGGPDVNQQQADIGQDISEIAEQ